MNNTQVKDLMTECPTFIHAKTNLQEAAEIMRDINCGVLPIGSEDDIQGIVTDRDLVTRALAEGFNPCFHKVGDYMTPVVYTCSEEDHLTDAADKMWDHNISRLIVVDLDGKVTGILSFGDILRRNRDQDETFCAVMHAVHHEAA